MTSDDLELSSRNAFRLTEVLRFSCAFLNVTPSIDFGLGQICRGCGDCSECMPCPSRSIVPTSTPSLYTAGSPTSSPFATSESIMTTSPVPAMTDVGTPLTSDFSIDDCSACSNLTPAQEKVLGSYDNGGKMIVCDSRCVDGVSDQTHCNCKYICNYRHVTYRSI